MRHLLDIADLGGRDGISEMLDLTAAFVEVSNRSVPKVPALRGRTVAWLFYENSTRTRLSFETAAKRLSADTANFAVSTSSVAKGESLRDTVRTVEAMGIDAVVVRHSSSGAPHRIASWVDAAVVNAGDGRHQHPTQALTDCYTLREHFGDLDGRRILIVGDIDHSRVARSDVDAFTALGAQVTLVGPPTLLPPDTSQWPVEVTHDLDEALATGPDVVYLLRLQRERMHEALLPSAREYRSRWGLTTERDARLDPATLVMHPGPMNRGVEIDAEVADGPRSVITEQVTNGVAVRMAVLYRLLTPAGGSVEEPEPSQEGVDA